MIKVINKKGQSKEIRIGSDSSGISIQYIKSRNILWITGWYDHIVGIEGTEIPFDEFCDCLGIRNPKWR